MCTLLVVVNKHNCYATMHYVCVPLYICSQEMCGFLSSTLAITSSQLPLCVSTSLSRFSLRSRIFLVCVHFKGMILTAFMCLSRCHYNFTVLYVHRIFAYVPLYKNNYNQPKTRTSALSLKNPT